MNGQVTIVHVLPTLLGTYGDSGNALVLRHRAAARGLHATIIEIAPGNPVPASADLYVLGGGQGDQQTRASELLRVDTGLREAFRREAPMLAVCAGMQVLGEWFTDAHGRRVAGMGLLDLVTESLPQRAVGDVVADVTAFADMPTLVGFENHRGGTTLGATVRPLARIRRGIGNGGGDHLEGVVGGPVVGTYLHGPVLALNPALADHMLERLVGPLPPMEDRWADAFRASRLSRALG